MKGIYSRASAEARHVFPLAAPIAIMQAGMVLFSTVDTLFMGRVGAQAVASVGLAATTFWTLALFGVGTLLGLDPVAARAFGAGDRQGCARAFRHSLVLALVLAVPLFALLSLAGPAYAWVGVEAETARAAVDFLAVFRWTYFPALLFVSCRQYLQAMGVTRPLLLAIVGANGVNVLLNYALVFGRLGCPALGPRGSAFATLSAYVFLLACAALAAALRSREAGYRFDGWQGGLFSELLRVGLPSGLSHLAEVGVFGAVTVLMGRLGPADLAAHQITLNLASVTFMVPLGIGAAAAVRVGQGLGRGSPRAAVGSGDAALGLAVAFMTATSALFLLVPRAVVGLYTSDPGVLEAGQALLRIAALFQIADGIQIVLAGALRGLGETRLPMLANLAGHWALGLPLGASLAFHHGWRGPGLWTGLLAGLLCVAALLMAAWRRRATQALRREAAGPALAGAA